MATHFDPNAAAPPDSGVFGLPHSPDEAQVVLVPVPFEATTTYGGGTAEGPAPILERQPPGRPLRRRDRPPLRGAASPCSTSPRRSARWNDEAKAARRSPSSRPAASTPTGPSCRRRRRGERALREGERVGLPHHEALAGRRARSSASSAAITRRLRLHPGARREVPRPGRAPPRRARGSARRLRGLHLVARVDHVQRGQAPAAA